MSLWAGIAIGISCALIVLAAVSLYRGYHVIKVLKELYYFQVFTLDRYPVNELVVGNSIKYAIKRWFIHVKSSYEQKIKIFGRFSSI